MIKNKAKDFKVLNYLNHGIFRGYTLFSSGFTYNEIIDLLKKDKKFLGQIYLRGLNEETHKHLIDDAGNGGVAIRSLLKNKKTTKDVDYIHYVILGTEFNVDDDSCMCVLAHELLHICQFFLPDYLDRDEEKEAEAHFHSHLMRQALQILRGK